MLRLNCQASKKLNDKTKDENKPIIGKQKKSLIAMLKKIDGKLLDVLHKNSDLLNKSQVRKLSQEKLCQEEQTMVPKDLCNRKIINTKRKSSCKSVSSVQLSKSARMLAVEHPSKSYIQIDLSKSGSTRSIGKYLAQPNYNSSILKITADDQGSLISRRSKRHKTGLSNTLGSLKQLEKSKTLKKLPKSFINNYSVDSKSRRCTTDSCSRYISL